MSGGAWLIEVSGKSGPSYMCGVSASATEWPFVMVTGDHMEAVRFSRREDAARVIRSVEMANPYGRAECGLWAVEHMWLGPSPASPAERPIEPRETDSLLASEARVKVLREALEPFVQHYDSCMDRHPDDAEVSDFSRHTYGQLRAAIAALSALEGGGVEEEQGVASSRAMSGGTASPKSDSAEGPR